MRKIVCITILCVLSISMPTVYAQQCDPKVQKKAVDNWKLQYRERENRCEGFYTSTVSSKLDVVGVTEGRFHFALEKEEIMTLSSSFVIDQPIQVRAVGIPSKTYYRMDARIDPEGTLVWPVADVLDVEKLPAKEVGVFGWIGTETEKVYVPLAVANTIEPVDNDGKIRFVVRPAIDVENVQWRVADVVDGACGQMGAWEKPRKSSYKKGQPITFILPEREGAELCMEMAARSEKTAEWEKKLSRVIVGRE